MIPDENLDPNKRKKSTESGNYKGKHTKFLPNDLNFFKDNSLFK